MLNNKYTYLIVSIFVISHVTGKNKSIKELILANAPWRIKLMMLNQITPEELDSTNTSPIKRMMSTDNLQSAQDSESKIVNRRRRLKTVVAIEHKADNKKNEDDNNLRIKLFRLMYETIRDNDVKVKRAELIRNHYTNTNTFEIGYLIGEVQDKYDVMMEFRNTLRIYYKDWKPIEHINAYEQITNYAVQISNLVDIIQTNDKNATKIK